MPGRWGSFVADAAAAHVLHEVGNPAHPLPHRARTQLAAATRAVDLLRGGGADRPAG